MLKRNIVHCSKTTKSPIRISKDCIFQNISTYPLKHRFRRVGVVLHGSQAHNHWIHGAVKIVSKCSAGPIASCWFPRQCSECPRPRRQKSSSCHCLVICFNLAWEIQHPCWFIYCIWLFIRVSLGETRLSPHTLQFPRSYSVWSFWWVPSSWKFSGSSNPNTRTFCLLFRS